MNEFQAEHEEMVNEEEQLIMGMKKFEKEGFSKNKTYSPTNLGTSTVCS